MDADGMMLLLIAALTGLAVLLFAIVVEHWYRRYQWRKIHAMKLSDPVAAGHRKVAMMGRKSHLGFK